MRALYILLHRSAIYSVQSGTTLLVSLEFLKPECDSLMKNVRMPVHTVFNNVKILFAKYSTDVCSNDRATLDAADRIE